jgi:hypothetical protein
MRHTIWMPQDMRECRWAQPQFRPQRDADGRLADAPWECVRKPGEERPITESECAHCEHWELDTF